MRRLGAEGLEETSINSSATLSSVSFIAIKPLSFGYQLALLGPGYLRAPAVLG